MISVRSAMDLYICACADLLDEVCSQNEHVGVLIECLRSSEISYLLDVVLRGCHDLENREGRIRGWRVP